MVTNQTRKKFAMTLCKQIYRNISKYSPSEIGENSKCYLAQIFMTLNGEITASLLSAQNCVCLLALYADNMPEWSDSIKKDISRLYDIVVFELKEV